MIRRRPHNNVPIAPLSTSCCNSNSNSNGGSASDEEKKDRCNSSGTDNDDAINEEGGGDFTDDGSSADDGGPATSPVSPSSTTAPTVGRQRRQHRRFFLPPPSHHHHQSATTTSSSCEGGGIRPLVVFMILLFMVHHVTVVQHLSFLMDDPTSVRAGIRHLPSSPSSSPSSSSAWDVSDGLPQHQLASESASRMKALLDDSTRKGDILSQRLKSMVLASSTRTVETANHSHRSNNNNNNNNSHGVAKMPSVSVRSRMIPYVKYDPPFETIKKQMDAGNVTAGQFLLDFAIVGFPKCGTTTMMQWLGSHPEIAAIQKELQALQRSHPATVLRYVTKQLPEGRYRRGYKSPNDVEDQRAINKLALHFPQTKLIVGLRHPVLWFESFYNHRIQNGISDMPPAQNMTRACTSGYHGVCISRGSFHFALVKLGKTLLARNTTATITTTTEIDEAKKKELKMFSTKEQNSLLKDLPLAPLSVLPNPIFLYDTSQLVVDTDHDGGNPYYDQFVTSLQEYLGLSEDSMPPMIKSSPGKKGLNATEQARRNGLKIDICRDVYSQQRKWLVESGKRTSDWLRHYFITSPDVTVGGNRQQFDEILDSYGIDPCIERNRKEKLPQ